MNCVCYDQTPLSKAVGKENLDLIDILFASGADVHQRVPTLNGGTILQQACSVLDFFICI